MVASTDLGTDSGSTVYELPGDTLGVQPFDESEQVGRRTRQAVRNLTAITHINEHLLELCPVISVPPASLFGKQPAHYAQCFELPCLVLVGRAIARR
nr:hypothetical protein [Arthrobacter sp. ov407]